jgi:ketosteroid isomerase-like protein
MSQDNIAIVRAFYKSWTDKDIDGVLERLDPEVEFDWSASRAPYQGIYRGHEGLMQFWSDQVEAWEEFSVEIAEAIECGPECVITVTVVRGRGRGSGIAMEAGGASVWRLREGAILSGKLFQGKEEALEAAGLP